MNNFKVKYQSNDIIYFFDKNKLEKGIIINIHLNIKNNIPDIKYEILPQKYKNTHYNYIKLNEHEIFKNLKQIIKDIKKQYTLL
jgi:hypothetical protein